MIEYSTRQPRPAPPKPHSVTDDVKSHEETSDEISFASHMNIEHSVTDASPTFLIDAETGKRVHHYIEVLTPGNFETVLGKDTVTPNSVCRTSSHGISREFRRAMGKTMEKLVDLVLDDACSRRPKMMNDDNVDNMDWLKKEQIVIMWPAQTLQSGHRYIVALGKLPSASRRGHFIDTPKEFETVRDNSFTFDFELQQKQRHYQGRDIIGTLLNQKHFSSRQHITYAWDFSTASSKTSTETLAHMRDTVFDLFDQWNQGEHKDTDLFSYTITKTEDNVKTDKHIARLVEGTFKMPMFLDTEKATAKAKLKRNLDAPEFLDRLRPSHLDENGQMELVDVPFIFWIPYSSAKSHNATIFQYGHGLFADRYESTVPFMHKMIDDLDSVAIVTDWWGLTDSDMPMIHEIITGDFFPIDGRLIPWQERMGSIMDRSAQGIVNQLALAELVRTSSAMHNDPKVFYMNEQCVFELTPEKTVRDTQFYGLSLGGILGTTYLSLSSTVQSAVISVPGGPFSNLINRNPQGDMLFSAVLPLLWKTAADRAKLLLMASQLFDIIDPAAHTHALGRLKSSRTKPPIKKKILIQAAVGDVLVNPVARQFLTRTLGAKNIDNVDQIAYRAWFKNSPTSWYRYGWIAKSGTQYGASVDDEICPVHLVDPDTSRRFTKHDVVLQVFQYKGPWILPFTPKSPNFIDATIWDTHSLPRFTPEGKVQVVDFFKRNQACRADEGCDDESEMQVSPACGSKGCWNLNRPPLDF